MPSSRSSSTTRRGRRGPDPAKGEGRAFGRTCLVTIVALAVANVLGWFRVFGLHGLRASDIGAILLFALGTWLVTAFLMMLPTAFAVVFARRPMLRSPWHARGIMAFIALVWTAVASLITQAFADLQTTLDLASIVWPSILLVTVACVLLAPWIVRDPAADPGLRA